MEINFSKKTFFVVLAVIAANAIMALFVVMPILSEIESSGLRVREQRDKIASCERRIAAVREFAVFAKEERTNLDKLDKVFVDAQLPLDFINVLERVARDTSVGIEFSSSIIQPKKADSWPMVGIEAQVAGETEAILRFIKKIETSPYLVEIQGVEIQIDIPQKEESPVNNGTTTVQAGIPDKSRTAQAHILLKAYAK
jgi:hypothetical protein